MSEIKPNRVDQVDISIPLNQHDGDIPNLKSFDEIFTLINESVESGKIFTVK